MNQPDAMKNSTRCGWGRWIGRGLVVLLVLLPALYPLFPLFPHEGTAQSQVKLGGALQRLSELHVNVGAGAAQVYAHAYTQAQRGPVLSEGLVLSVQPPLLAQQQPVLQVSPTSLSFEGRVGGPQPEPQYLTVANTGEGVMEWHAFADVGWIILGGTEGKLSGGREIQLLVLVEIQGLEAGKYQGTITISSSNAQGSPVYVAVTLILEEQFLVCPSGCPFTNIQAAIDASHSGDTITIGPGTYRENLHIEKDLTIFGTNTKEIAIRGREENRPVIRIEGAAVVALQNLTVAEAPETCETLGEKCSHGFLIRGRARVSLQQVKVSSNFGLWVFDTAQVSLRDSILADNLRALYVFGTARVSLDNCALSDNWGTGLVLLEGARAEVRGSMIEGNGTSEVCNSEEVWCGGILLANQSQLTLTDSIVRSNADWGVGAILKVCGWDVDNFTGSVVFQGNNQIYGNNKTGNHDGQGNPGNHPFRNLPDGQVCLP